MTLTKVILIGKCFQYTIVNVKIPEDRHAIEYKRVLYYPCGSSLYKGEKIPIYVST
jgi:hypothetical protein